jgi:formate hydrogenlyase subunit 5
MSQIASAAGMTVGQSQLSRVKEELLRLCADLVGSRYLHNAVRLFASTTIDWNHWLPEMEQRLKDMDRRIHHFVRLLLETPSFVDRLLGTGIVTRDWAEGYALVGPVARACGISTDVRQESVDFRQLGYRTCVSERATGDARDRFDIRAAEWKVSLAIVFGAVKQLSQMPSKNRPQASDLIDSVGGAGWGVGVVEGPRGRIAHAVYVQNGKIHHFGIRSGSAWNWPVLGLATANGNIQTDFPVIDASFGLSCAGMDR